MIYISVIIPVYNSEKTIVRCVNSVCAQTYENIEVILVDDGSKDKSAELCDTLAQKDNRITVIHKKNGGVSTARNSGIEFAKGQYILFVDSDDMIPNDYCECVIGAQKKWGENAFIWTGVDIISDNGAVPAKSIKYSTAEYDAIRRSDVLKLSAKSLLNSPCNKLYHTNIVINNHLRMNERISIAEDLLFNLQYMDAIGEDPIVILNDVSYYYVRNGQASLDYGYKKNYYDIHKKILDILWKCCHVWQVPAEDISLYYQRYWDYMQGAFSNLISEDCKLSKFQKFWEKSKITADGYFQKSLVQHKNEFGRISYLMWRSRIYLLVFLYERIRKLI